VQSAVAAESPTTCSAITSSIALIVIAKIMLTAICRAEWNILDCLLAFEAFLRLTTRYSTRLIFANACWSL